MELNPESIELLRVAFGAACRGAIATKVRHWAQKRCGVSTQIRLFTTQIPAPPPVAAGDMQRNSRGSDGKNQIKTALPSFCAAQAEHRLGSTGHTGGSPWFQPSGRFDAAALLEPTAAAGVAIAWPGADRLAVHCASPSARESSLCDEFGEIPL